MALDIATLGVEIKSISVTNATNSLKQFENEAKRAQTATDQFISSSDKLGNSLLQLTKIAAGVFAGFSLAGYARDAVMMAARYETLGIVMEQAGKNAGYSSQQMRTFEKALQSAGIAMQESRQVLTRLSTAQVDLSKSAQLARAAQDLAVVGGINSSEAFSRLTYGITSAQVEVLRTIGLNVNFEQSYKNLASQIGKTTGELTGQERTQARVNAVLESAAKYTGIYEESMKTAGKQLSSLTRYFDNIKTMIGETGLDAFSYALQGVTAEAKSAEAALQKMRESGELANIGKTVGQSFATAASYIDEAVVALTAWTVARKLATSETLLGLAADTQLHGLAAVIKDRILAANVAEQERIATINAKIQIQRAAIQQEIQVLELEQLRGTMAVKRASELAARTIGTQNEARAVAVLEAAEKRLVATDTALAASQAKLAAAMATTTAGATTSSAAFGVLRASGLGLINMLGGPVVASFTAVAIAAYSVYSKMGEHEKTISDQQQSFDKLVASIEKVPNALNNATEAMRQNEIRVAESKLKELREQFDEFSASTLQFKFPDTGAVVGPIVRIQREARDAMLTADSLANRVLAIQDAIAKLGLITNPFNQKAIETATYELQKMLEQYNEIVTAQEKLEQTKFGPDVSVVETATAALEAYNKQLDQIDAAYKKFSETGLPATFEEAATYLDKYTAQTVLGKAAAEELEKSARKTAIAILEQAAAAAEFDSDFERYEKIMSMITEYNKRIDSGIAKGGKGTDLKTAKAAIESINQEISRMLGMDTSETTLEKKLKEIAKAGKDAGMTASQIKSLIDKYEAAFGTQRAKVRERELLDIEATIAELGGNESLVRTLKLTNQLEDLKNKLANIGVVGDQATDIMNRFAAATEKQFGVKDAQTAAQFMREYAELAGNSNLYTQKTNELLQIQAEIFRTQLPEALRPYVEEWVKLKQAQESADPYQAVRRSMERYAKESTDTAKQVEELFTNAFKGIEDAFVNFVQTGKLSFRDLANSIIADLTRMAVKQAMGGLVGALLQALPTTLGGLGGGGAGGSTIGASASKFSSIGSSLKLSFANGGYASETTLPSRGGILTSPTYFESYGPAKAYANGGLSLAGEAGPEVFMPAQPMRDGKMGVRVKMEDQARPVIHIHPTIVDKTSKGVDTSVNVTEDAHGNVQMEILINEISARIASDITKGVSPIGTAIDSTRGTSTAYQTYRG